MAESEVKTPPEASQASPSPRPPSGADREGSPRRDRGPGDGRGRGGGKRFFRRRKVDYFSVNRIDHIDYKDVETLKQFVGDRGKINPRRHTGLSAKHQRELRRAIKRARNLALLPFAGVVEKPKTGGRSEGRSRSDVRGRSEGGGRSDA